MTIGERIAQIRKEQGLSQETFGEALGVSRQSISKWEANQTVPEVEKLISMHRLYNVSVGWLLGTEEEREAPGHLSEDQLKMVDEIVQKYIDAMPKQESKPPKYTKIWMLSALLFMCAFIINMINVHNRFNSLDNQQRNMEYSIDRIQSSVDAEVASIGNRVEEIIQKQNSILAGHEAKRGAVDLRAGTLQVELSATPKTYVPGMKLSFVVDDGTQIITVPGVEGDNRLFTANAQCALTDEIDISVVLHSGGTEQTQLIESWGYLFSETKLETDTWFWESHFWATNVAELKARIHPLDTLSAPLVYENLEEPIRAEALEYLIYINGELELCLDAEKGVSEFIINNMSSSEYVKQQGREAFSAQLDGELFSKLGPGDELQILVVVTDNYGRRYVSYATAFVVGHDGDLDFCSVDIEGIEVDGIIDSVVKY